MVTQAAIYPVCHFIGSQQGTHIEAIVSVLPAVGMITYYAKSLFNQVNARNQNPLPPIVSHHINSKKLFIISCTVTLVTTVALNFLTMGLASAVTALTFSGVSYLCTTGYQLYGILENQKHLQAGVTDRNLIWW